MKKNNLITFFIILLLSSCLPSVREPASKMDILFIGDSQTRGPLGQLIYNHLKDSPSVGHVDIYGIGSSSPRHWQDPSSEVTSSWLLQQHGRYNDQRIKMSTIGTVPQDKSVLSYLLEMHHPHFIVFQFLGNSMGKSKEYIFDKVTGMLSKLDESQECLYISSPPYYMELSEKNIKRSQTQDFFIEAIGTRCQIVKGFNEEMMQNFATHRSYYVNDLIHLSDEGAYAFYQKIRTHLP